MTITHPAGPGTVAQILTQRIRARLVDWTEETDQTTWRAEDDNDYCGPGRWVIVAVGQLAAHDPYDSRPGPLVVASGGGVEIRIQLPHMVGQDDIDNVMETLTRFGAIPAEEAEAR